MNISKANILITTLAFIFNFKQSFVKSSRIKENGFLRGMSVYKVVCIYASHKWSPLILITDNLLTAPN